MALDPFFQQGMNTWSAETQARSAQAKKLDQLAQTGQIRARHILVNSSEEAKEIMDEIGTDAQAKGLTPEILESMLREE